jgi:periplasmic divalent cation tolerance protein
MQLCMAYITAKDVTEARLIAQALVEKKLAACVNLFPEVESFYEYEGKLENAREVVIVAKTAESLKDKLTAIVKALHSYETPCIVFYNMDGGETAYLKWMGDQLPTIVRP